MKTAFVAGSTGLTGRNVIHALRERGHRAVAHVRADSPHLEDARRRAEAVGAEVDTTPWERAALADRLRALAPDVVFALLGTTKKRAREAARRGRRADYEAVDYGLTALLIDACVEAGVRPRFVYLSALGASEGTRSDYMAARVKAEAKLRESGLPWTIARPSFIVGPRDDARPLERVGAGVADRLLFFLGAAGMGPARDRYRSITGERLARALVALAFDPAAESRVVESQDLQRRG